MFRIVKFVMLDILKNRIVLAYTLLIAILSWSTFTLEDNISKGLLTLLNIMLMTVPLVSIIFSTIYLYNSNEFIELLVSQPIKRNRIWISLYTGLSMALTLSFLIGQGLPLLFYAPTNTAIMFNTGGILITLTFTSLAFVSAVLTRDKAKGIGISIMLWIFFTMLFDGLLLFLLFQFSDYPIEKPMLALCMLSPIDMVRILLLLQLDISALLGYTGALFQNFYGTFTGMIIAGVVLIIWIFIPFLISLYRFNHKDL